MSFLSSEISIFHIRPQNKHFLFIKFLKHTFFIKYNTLKCVNGNFLMLGDYMYFLPFPQALLLNFPYFQKDLFCFGRRNSCMMMWIFKYPVCTNVETWDVESKK